MARGHEDDKRREPDDVQDDFKGPVKIDMKIGCHGTEIGDSLLTDFGQQNRGSHEHTKILESSAPSKKETSMDYLGYLIKHDFKHENESERQNQA